MNFQMSSLIDFILEWPRARQILGRKTARGLRRCPHLNGKTVDQVAMPFHFGSAGPVQGSATNDLVPISGEPNVTITEAKALACNIVPGRLPRGPKYEEWIKKYVPVGGPPNLHPEQPPPRARHGLETWRPDTSTNSRSDRTHYDREARGERRARRSP